MKVLSDHIKRNRDEECGWEGSFIKSYPQGCIRIPTPQSTFPTFSTSSQSKQPQTWRASSQETNETQQSEAYSTSATKYHIIRNGERRDEREKLNKKGRESFYLQRSSSTSLCSRQGDWAMVSGWDRSYDWSLLEEENLEYDCWGATYFRRIRNPWNCLS